MARILYRSKRIALGTAFISVMVGAGGLLGAVAGVALALLGRSVLGINAGIAEFISASVAVGALSAMALGVCLATGQALPLFLRSKVAATSSVESK